MHYVPRSPIITETSRCCIRLGSSKQDSSALTQTIICRTQSSEEQVLKTPLSRLGPLSVSRRGNLRAEQWCADYVLPLWGLAGTAIHTPASLWRTTHDFCMCKELDSVQPKVTRSCLRSASTIGHSCAECLPCHAS